MFVTCSQKKEFGKGAFNPFHKINITTYYIVCLKHFQNDFFAVRVQHFERFIARNQSVKQFT